MNLKHLLTSLCICIAGNVFAQSRTTEIWMTDITMKDGKPVASVPVRITDNDFYDNQPYFSPDGSELWYASMPDTIQSDIFGYNLKKKEFRQITNTPESEYQPQPIPFDKSKMSVVRVDADNGQRFYEMKLDGTELSTLMNNEDSVAYYCWMNDTTLGVYMLNGGGGVLEQYDMIPQQAIILMQGGFGRCVARIPGSDNLSYVQKGSDGKYTLMRFEMATEERWPIAEMMGTVEDYCWAPDGKIYASEKSKLYFFDTKKEGAKWVEVADFTKTVGTFYRLTMNSKGDKIAMVSYKGTKP
ncbi:hypothetical protein BH11BAC2_BH11BAC2_15140 [soil metagenome]